MQAIGFPGVHPMLFGRTGCRWSKAEADALRGVLELGPAVARPIRPVQARREFFLVGQSGRPVPFGRAAAARMAGNSRKPSQRKFARRHPEAGRAAASFRLAAPFQSIQNGTHPISRGACKRREDRLPLPARRRRPIGSRTVAKMLNPYKLLPGIAGCDTWPSPSFLCFAFFLLVRGPDLPQSTVRDD